MSGQPKLKRELIAEAVQRHPAATAAQISRLVDTSRGFTCGVMRHLAAKAAGWQRCTGCGKTKPAESFNAGYCYCKACWRSQRRDYGDADRNTLDSDTPKNLYRLSWSSDGSYYIGLTTKSVEDRVNKHRTSSRNPHIKARFAAAEPQVDILATGLVGRKAHDAETAEIYAGGGAEFALCLNTLQASPEARERKAAKTREFIAAQPPEVRDRIAAKLAPKPRQIRALAQADGGTPKARVEDVFGADIALRGQE